MADPPEMAVTILEYDVARFSRSSIVIVIDDANFLTRSKSEDEVITLTLDTNNFCVIDVQPDDARTIEIDNIP
nr:hypothetical protein [Novosphingobium kaempferiae]